MTIITIAFTAIVVSAFTTVANSFAGMIAAQSIAVAITGRAAGVT